MDEKELIEKYSSKSRLDVLFVVKTIILPELKKHKLTRKTTAEILEINQHTLNNYLCNGMGRMPYDVFSNICNLLELNKAELINKMNYN